ncbi:sulfatase-like hydrolase/transferase [Candidatus Eisenbacteria bacterium]|uniref:Sulfatase-like hydrolase/transferase n=1 Tax=Eiseniibacteriota bacterium TaxID=2212470 RepID=A0ABV6YML8_UNCEI
MTQPGPLSVLLITVDTLRPDRLSCYGWTKGKTPVIDELASTGVLFEKVVTPVPITLPAHAAILTGRYPLSLGVRNNGTYRLDESARTLAELFKDAGYRTGAFVGSYVLDSCFGLAQGFDAYNDEMPRKASSRGGKAVARWENPQRRADVVVEAATQWLTGDRQTPFFAWIHIWDPHHPYAPPEPFRDRFSDDPYFGEVAFVDEQLGVLFESLRGAGLMGDRTLVVFTSDHGEGLGEHGEASHGVFLYETTVRVPLIFNLPTVFPSRLRVPDMVRLIDIAPTILDLAGLAALADVEGKTLRSLLQGSADDPTNRAGGRDVCYLESLYGTENYGWAPLFGLHTGNTKYVRAPIKELYRMDQDPGESRNLADRESEAIKVLDRELDDLIESVSTDAIPAANTEQMDPETRAKLESLGYIWTSSAGENQSAEDRPDPKKMLAIDARRKRGFSLIKRGRLEEAIDILNEVAAEDPRNPRVWENLAKAYVDAGVLEKSLAAVDRGLELQPRHPNLNILRGTLLVQLGRTDEAVRHASGLLEILPDKKTVLYNLGSALKQQGRFGEALEHFAAAESMGLYDPMSPFERGSIHFREGRYAEAVDAFGRAVELKPDFALAWHNIGVCSRRLDRYEDARIAYEKAVELNPGNARFRSSYGYLLTQSGHGQEALRQLQRALEIDPEFADAHINLARLYAVGPDAVRDAGAAVRHAESALEYAGESPPADFLDVYAEALFADGRVSEALDANARLRAAHPESDHYREQRERFSRR